MKSNQFDNSIYDITIRLLITLLIVVWCLMIIYPFASIVLWSLILTLALLPLHKSLSERLGGSPKLSSFIIVFSIIVILVVPTAILIGNLLGEVKEQKANYENGTFAIPPPNEKVKEWPLVGDKLYDTWLLASQNLEETISVYQKELLDLGKKLIKGTTKAASGVFQILVSLVIAGFMMVYGGIGESIRKFFRKLAGNRGDEFADVTTKTISNVVKGVLGVALILAVLHGIIFILAGVPYAGIWVLLILILGILQIPIVIVTLPIIVYLYATIDLGPAIMWTVVLILAGLSDNVLKPILLGKGAPVPMPVIFVGVIGGFVFSGFIGLFTGAIVLSIGYKLLIGWVNSNNEVSG